MDTLSKKSYTAMVLVIILIVLTLLLAGCTFDDLAPAYDTASSKDTPSPKITTKLTNSSVSDDLDTAMQELDQLER